MEVDYKQYWKSFKIAHLWRIILFFGVAYFFFFIFKPSINTYWVDGFLQFFPRSIFSDLLCFSLLVYIILKVTECISYKLSPTITSLFNVGGLILFYVLLIRVNKAYTLYPLQLHMLFAWIKYTDFLILFLCYLTLDFRAFHKSLTKQNHLSLIADDPNTEDVPDLIENESYVQKIAATINETAGKTSYAIGVFSSWGTGKTDFLLRLKKIINANTNENIVLEFNPWKAASTEGILEDFFSMLAGGLKPYNKSVAGKLKGYSKKILSTSKEIHYLVLDTFFDEIMKDQTLQERYDSINTSISQTGKRLIVIIDDLDRMSGVEVMQVLKVIRNSANFSNTFFIVALDHSYTVNVLKKTDQYFSEDQYLKKIFQLTVTLPQIRKSTFGQEIIRMLTFDKMPLEDKDKIERAVSMLKYDPIPFMAFGPLSSKEEGNLETMLENYRDVKRFCNSFKINFDILKNEVEVTDLFLIELIKTKSFYVYEHIANKTLLKHAKEQPHTYELSEEGWKYVEDTSGLDLYSLKDIKGVLGQLLGESKNKSSRQFSYPHNFYLYFCYQLFSLISLKTFQETIQLSSKEMRQMFDTWAKEGKRSDLNRILDNFSEYKNKEQFEKFLKAYLIGAGDYTSRARRMVMEVEKNSTAYFNGKDEYKKFIHEILQDDSLSLYNRAIIASELLKQSVYDGTDLLFPKTELQEIIYRLFDLFLKTKHGYDDEVYSFYLLNDDHRDTDGYIFLNPKAHKRMLEFLRIPENFEGFLRTTIRSRSQPTEGEFVFAPFSKDIFENWSVFKSMAEKHESQDEEMKALIPIIVRNTNEYLTGKDRFHLDGKEKELVLNYLRSTKQYNF